MGLTAVAGFSVFVGGLLFDEIVSVNFAEIVKEKVLGNDIEIVNGVM